MLVEIGREEAREVFMKWKFQQKEELKSFLGILFLWSQTKRKVY